MMSSIALVLGYGIFEKSNTNYKSYLDRILPFIKERQAEKIILCGGHTNKNVSISEAFSIRTYLIEEEPTLSPKIILEEKSITTPQNLEFSSQILVTSSITPEIITVFCDSIRAPKVYYLSLRYFSSFLSSVVTEEQIYRSLLAQVIEKKMDVTKDLELKYENLSVVGIDLNRDTREIGDQIIATMEEIGGYNYSSVDRDILEYKKKKFGISS